VLTAGAVERELHKATSGQICLHNALVATFQQRPSDGSSTLGLIDRSTQSACQLGLVEGEKARELDAAAFFVVEPSRNLELERHVLYDFLHVLKQR
jgi:hypothetical protein